MVGVWLKRGATRQSASSDLVLKSAFPPKRAKSESHESGNAGGERRLSTNEKAAPFVKSGAAEWKAGN
jgi:hypothetical protein